MELTSRRLIGLLAEPDRRQVVAALILGAETVAEVVAKTGMDDRAVVMALGRLEQAGLVESFEDQRYLLLSQAFERAARSEAPAPAPSEFPDQPEEKRRILDQVMDDGRLTRLPAKHSHKLVVLDHLVQRFEPGEKYSERQVNAMLSSVFADTATLRRYLVDVNMLDRGDGFYWRSGGTFTID